MLLNETFKTAEELLQASIMQIVKALLPDESTKGSSTYELFQLAEEITELMDPDYSQSPSNCRFFFLDFYKASGSSKLLVERWSFIM